MWTFQSQRPTYRPTFVNRNSIIFIFKTDLKPMARSCPNAMLHLIYILPRDQLLMSVLYNTTSHNVIHRFIQLRITYFVIGYASSDQAWPYTDLPPFSHKIATQNKQYSRASEIQCCTELRAEVRGLALHTGTTSCRVEFYSHVTLLRVGLGYCRDR